LGGQKYTNCNKINYNSENFGREDMVAARGAFPYPPLVAGLGLIKTAL